MANASLSRRVFKILKATGDPLRQETSLELLPLALRRRAVEQADRLAFRFLGERGELQQELTYEELDLRVRAIAATLQRAGEEGERVLLLFPPGLEFLAAFMACQYASRVAVPMQPPAGLRLKDTGTRPENDPARRRVFERLNKVAMVVEDCGATTVLTSGVLGQRIEALCDLVPALRRLRWLRTELIDNDVGAEWREPAFDPRALALLQYTSGSTSRPKGVAVAHRHLVSNAAAIRELARLEPDTDVTVSWLPPYHDMGLIGNMVQQIFDGMPQTLMSPLAFMKRPAVWLRVLSAYRASVTSAPNFAFDLCASKATPELLSELDLSRLRLIVVGGEPVRAATLDRFARTFAVCGVNPEAFHPCYGLAESTLIVTGRTGVRSVAFDADQLRSETARPARSKETALELVSCGRPLAGAQVRIVDPRTTEPCPDGIIGEIWVASDHVADGYFGRRKATAEAFEAVHRGSDTRYLRTGDAGMIHEGELFVTGRYKDVMIFAGANHHPHDIELTVTKAHEALDSDSAVAFAVHDDGRDRLVVGVELRRVPGGERSELADAIRRVVLAEHGLHVDEVVAMRPRAVPRTSSGKPQRYLARQRFESGELGEVAE